jgi:hypothetical protein
MNKRKYFILRGIFMTAILLMGCLNATSLIAQTGNKPSPEIDPSTDVYTILRYRAGTEEIDSVRYENWNRPNATYVMYCNTYHYWTSIIPDERWRIVGMQIMKNTDELFHQIMFVESEKFPEDGIMKLDLKREKNTGLALWTWSEGGKITEFVTQMQPKK